ncbi:MAG: ABC transporter ATP-binding protein [Azospirillum sp.]|nr:ABC transporter ATP-binding protein [Azospirillum sp.]MCA3267888.1 ABC transporter ATP-binding protein [Azospirillum sp.]MCZ8122244.1 ABC transporter ATP-binding protein [Magnetospirillum sp.]
MSVPAINVRDLTKRFRDDGPPAVDAISFAVPRGTVVGLLGGNGAGKTTTISMLLGILVPTAGTVDVLGVDMVANRYPALARLNFSSPYVDLPARLSVRENLSVFGGLYGVAELPARIAELADLLDLGPILDRKTGSLSSGQKTRAALAKALINRPELLLLDEPTASLDPDTADRVRGHLADYAKRSGAAILLASHNMAEVERLCADVLMMKGGRIVDRGAPAALIARYGRADMEQVFLDVARGTRAEAAATP